MTWITQPLRITLPDERTNIVTIAIQRFRYNDDSIISAIMVKSNKTSNFFKGFALENAHAGIFHDKSPTPPGVYPGRIRADGKLGWRIELLNVPGHAHIEIHHGNFPQNSEGCFLPGLTESSNFVGHSDAAMRAIKSVIEADRSGSIAVQIVGGTSAP
ncbi:DUF5675 family protein [Acidiphilium sp. 37-64-53]|nr:DUF5675 family protein [Acidiphilium sp. 37-64-53]